LTSFPAQRTFQQPRRRRAHCRSVREPLAHLQGAGRTDGADGTSSVVRCLLA